MKKKKILTTIPSIPKVYTISFDINPNHFYPKWSSILHFTINGDVGKIGYRVPGVFIIRNKLSVCASVNGNSNYCVSQPIPVNKWTKVKIVQSKVGSVYWYSLYFDGKKVHSVQNKGAMVFKNVRVYATDPWYLPFDGSVRNLKISLAGKCY